MSETQTWAAVCDLQHELRVTSHWFYFMDVTRLISHGSDLLSAGVFFRTLLWMIALMLHRWVSVSLLNYVPHFSRKPEVFCAVGPWHTTGNITNAGTSLGLTKICVYSLDDESTAPSSSQSRVFVLLFLLPVLVFFFPVRSDYSSSSSANTLRLMFQCPTFPRMPCPVNTHSPWSRCVCRRVSVDWIRVCAQLWVFRVKSGWGFVLVSAPGRGDGERAASDSEKESRETRCHTDTGDGHHRWLFTLLSN